MPQSKPPDEFEHSVTYENTVKHWVLYTLDALEASREPDNDDEQNPARDNGTYPFDIYEYAAGKDSIVFRNKAEIEAALSEMARDGTAWEEESRPVNRRTEATDWEGADVQYRYRLNDYGRKVLLDLGVPQQLPNRRDFDEDDRSLGVKPAHQPGWWQPEYDLYSDEWDLRDNDWIPTDHERVFYKTEGAEQLGAGRGYTSIGEKLAKTFEDVTFVLTVGPYRMHDLMYAIRDPWNKVVQIDVYSPMAMCRGADEIQRSYEALIRDLRKGLESVNE